MKTSFCPIFPAGAHVIGRLMVTIAAAVCSFIYCLYKNVLICSQQSSEQNQMLTLSSLLKLFYRKKYLLKSSLHYSTVIFHIEATPYNVLDLKIAHENVIVQNECIYVYVYT